jgi:hypothetical protein
LLSISTSRRYSAAGRVTFLPLNRLTVRAHEIPDSGDVFPMLTKIKHDEAGKVIENQHSTCVESTIRVSLR